MFAIGGWAFLASSYQILSGASSISKGIKHLISKTELSKKDSFSTYLQLNFVILLQSGSKVRYKVTKICQFNLNKDRLNLKSLERRLICITQPLNHCLISQSNFNSLKQKPIDQSASLIEEIIQFIQRVNTTPNYVFDEDFSAELDHYCRELEFLIQTLQLSINLNNQFENIPIPLKLNQINEINRSHLNNEVNQQQQIDRSIFEMNQNKNEQQLINSKNDQLNNFSQQNLSGSNSMSMSAFSKASHRLRSMCLVSGYLLAQKGHLMAQISIQRSKDVVEYKWVQVFEGLSEMNIVFHPKYKRFQMDIFRCDISQNIDQKQQQNYSKQQQNQSQIQGHEGIKQNKQLNQRQGSSLLNDTGLQGNQSVPKINISNVSQSHIQDMSSDLERMIKRKKKYSFILNYQMAISIIRADSSLHSDLEQELKNFQGLNDEMYKKAPKIHIDHDSVQLLDIIQKQTKGEWIQWKCTSEDFMLVVSYMVATLNFLKYLDQSSIKFMIQDIMKRYPDRQIEKFAYCIDRDSQKISLNEQFSLIDIIYLLRLSAYENEQMSKFGYKQQKYVSQQLEFNREQRKSERIKGRGLIENELQNMKLDDKERELDVDCEVNHLYLTFRHYFIIDTVKIQCIIYSEIM